MCMACAPPASPLPDFFLPSPSSRLSLLLPDSFLALLPQVHDEVILEGPKESADDAKKLVVAHMANPWKAMIGQAVKDLFPQRTVSRVGGSGRRLFQRRGEDVILTLTCASGSLRPSQIKNDNGVELTCPSVPLLVELSTSSNIADTWYEAK